MNQGYAGGGSAVVLEGFEAILANLK
jgi:hypothetical protein